MNQSNIILFKQLPNTELIRQLELSCSVSPVIMLLCERLRKAEEESNKIDERNNAVTCPICLSELEVEIDTSGDLQLEVKK